MAKQHTNLEKSALGRNQSRKRPEEYKRIRKELKINSKFCPGYPLGKYITNWVKDNGSEKLGITRKDFPLNTNDKNLFLYKFQIIKRSNEEHIPHTLENPLDIEGFSLLKKGKDGLQAKCSDCERKWRRIRIAASRKRNSLAYSRNGEQGVYGLYKLRYGTNQKKCSKESGYLGKKILKPVEDFDISLSMETGIHNMCRSCQSSTSEATSGRWVMYNPDGNGTKNISKKNKFCKMKDTSEEICSRKKKNLHIDHIIPLQKGGSDHPENHMILCDTHNLSKQSKILITSISEISDSMVCERYHKILKKAKSQKWNVKKLEDRLAEAVQKFILSKHKMSNNELKDFLIKEKIKWNRKHNIDYNLKKFRKYCENKKDIN